MWFLHSLRAFSRDVAMLRSDSLVVSAVLHSLVSLPSKVLTAARISLRLWGLMFYGFWSKDHMTLGFWAVLRLRTSHPNFGSDLRVRSRTSWFVGIATRGLSVRTQMSGRNNLPYNGFRPWCCAYVEFYLGGSTSTSISISVFISTSIYISLPISISLYLSISAGSWTAYLDARCGLSKVPGSL